jgi:hypothetical protein
MNRSFLFKSVRPPIYIGILTLFGMMYAGAAKPQQWVSLIQGNSLENWEIKGGRAQYKLENGVVIGTTVAGGPNTFLCTKKHYGDFKLELDFLVDSEMNSGVQIRSHSLKKQHEERVFGYQVEIDPKERAWSGGIYDEGRRGWINNLKDNPAAGKAFLQDEWNHFRIETIGDSIRTWINGVPAADLVDSMTQEGFIGLQVHGTSQTDPMEVKWKNIRILELGHHTWKPLFNGLNLSGWKALPGGTWTVKDGRIIGKSTPSEKRHGLLLSNQSYDDFTVRFKFKVNKGDSGFYFRSDPVAHSVGIKGFQVEVDTSYETGGLYETGGRTWVVKPDEKNAKKIYRQGEWNEMSLSAHGRRVVVHLNGRKTAELKNDPGRIKGHFALQLHGGQEMDVEYKEIELLKAATTP